MPSAGLLEDLAKTIHAVSTSTRPEEVGRVILDACERLLKPEYALLCLPDAHEAGVLACHGRDLPATEDTAQWCRQIDTPRVFEHARPGDLPADWRSASIHALAALPIRVCQRPGALILGWANPRVLGPEDRALAQTLAQLAQSGLERTEERKKTRERAEKGLLEETHALYRAVIDDQTEFIVRWKPDGTRTFVNESYCRYFEQSRDELVGSNFFLLVPDEDRHRIRRKIARLSPSHPAETDIHRVVRPDGAIAWHEWTDHATFDAQGNVLELQSIGRDITDRKRADEELVQRKQFIETVLQYLPIGVISRRVSTRECLFLNQRFAEIHGHPEDVLRDHDLFYERLFPDPVYREEVQRQISEGLKSADPDRLRWSGVRILTADGEERAITISAIPLLEQDVTIFAVEDITERRSLEEQLRQAQKMEAIGQLAGGIAHDFNNLLTAIIGFSELSLEHLREEDPLRSRLVEIQSAGHRARRLTKQLLTFSRKQVLEATSVNLNRIVESVQSMLHRLLGEEIRLETRLDPRVGHVHADPSQLEQVLINLAVNARDAMPRGGQLTLETANVELTAEDCRGKLHLHPGPYIRLSVRDAGTGMEPKVLARIFEPFFTTKGVGKGTGLGLSTVYGIISQHGGQIDVESKVGQGTCFSIHLPQTKATDATLEDGRATGNPRGRGETVLVVEDNETVRHLAVATLEELGYRVLSCGDPLECLQRWGHAEEHIDLLLSDVVMPGIDGQELHRRLSAQYPRMKVIFMSGYMDNETVERLLNTPNVEFISKPFSFRDLSTKLREALRTKA